MEWCCFSFRRTCQVLLPPLQDTTVCIKADLPATEPSPDYSIPYSARIVPAGLFPFVCVFFFCFFSRRLWLRCLSCTWNWVSSLERDSTLLHHFLHFYRGRKCKGVLSHLSIPYHSAASSSPPGVWVCFLISAAERQRVLKSGCIQDLTPTDQACRGPR